MGATGFFFSLVSQFFLGYYRCQPRESHRRIIHTRIILLRRRKNKWRRGSRGNVKGERWEEGDRDVKERLPMTYVCRQSRVARLRNYWNTSCVRNKWRNMPWKVLVQDHPAIQETPLRYRGRISSPRRRRRLVRGYLTGTYLYNRARNIKVTLDRGKSRLCLPSMFSTPIAVVRKCDSISASIFHTFIADSRKVGDARGSRSSSRPRSKIHSKLCFTQLCVP